MAWPGAAGGVAVEGTGLPSTEGDASWSDGEEGAAAAGPEDGVIAGAEVAGDGLGEAGAGGDDGPGDAAREVGASVAG